MSVKETEMQTLEGRAGGLIASAERDELKAKDAIAYYASLIKYDELKAKKELEYHNSLVRYARELRIQAEGLLLHGTDAV